MGWIEPQYTRRVVRNAGRFFADFGLDGELGESALDIISNWRAAHAYPMHAMAITLRRMATQIDRRAIVAQRLKRLPSIVGKLHRLEHLGLDAVQDIGGVRAIMRSATAAEKLRWEMLSSRTRNEIHRIDDYVADPKKSGYRSIHLVYKYGATKTAYKGLRVELQLRSKIQHAWATAVEIVDTFTRQQLKTGGGASEWKEFFQYASAEFAKLEHRPVSKYLKGVNTNSRLKRSLTDLRAAKRLQDYAATVRMLTKYAKRGQDFYLIQYDGKEGIILGASYSTANLGQALDQYRSLELRAKEEPLFDVVFVAARNISQLKAAYPNYFADSLEFLTYLARTVPVNLAAK